MKWHLICLLTVLLSLNPVQAMDGATAVCPAASAGPQVSGSSRQSNTPWHALFLDWQAIVLAYGALPGRVTLCRWRLVWRVPRRRRKASTRSRKSSRPDAPAETNPGSPAAPAAQSCQKLAVEQATEGGRDQKATLACPPSPLTAAVTAARPERAAALPAPFPDTSTAVETADTNETTPIRLSQVLRPGVLLTGHGLKLRPFIARLGDTLEEYQALWADRERFVAPIKPLLKRKCALCGSEAGFRRYGSSKRTLILPGQKTRTSFRVQKIQCRGCNTITRILPTFCAPYKHHHLQTIQNAIENCWRRNTSYRDTTGILNQSRPADEQYVGHTLPYEWTIWLGGITIHLPQLLVWLGMALPRHGLMDEFFLDQDKGTPGDRRIFAITIQDPESDVIWNILRADRNDNTAFKDTLRQLKAVEIRLRALTTDGWPAILRAVRDDLADALHLLCHFHAKQNVFETLENYRRAKQLPKDAPELAEWRRAFFEVLDAPTPKLYRARLRKLTRRAADEPILLARCKSLRKKSNYYTARLRSPLLAATTSRIELTFKFLTRKIESLYSFRRSRCNAAQKSLNTWALVRNFLPYLPGAKNAGRSPAELAGVDLQGLPWLQYVNLKLSEVT